MSAYDFVLYCAGGSTVMVAAAFAWRLIRTKSGVDHGTAAAPVHTPKWVTVSDVDPTDIIDPATVATNLPRRLSALQAARFASPIVQRVLRDDVGPPMRPRIVPPTVPPAPGKGRSFSQPVQARPSLGKITPKALIQEHDTAVVPIPLKLKKTETPEE